MMSESNLTKKHKLINTKLVGTFFILSTLGLISPKLNATTLTPFADFLTSEEFKVEFKNNPQFQTMKKHRIDKSVMLKVSNQGLNKISKFVPQIMKEVHLNKGQIQNLDLNVPPFGLQTLEEAAPESFKNKFKLMSLFLENILKTKINEFKPLLNIKGLKYDVELSALVLKISEFNPYTNQLIINAQFEIKNLNIQIDRLKFIDQNNKSFLGKIELDQIETQLPLVAPLKVSLNVQVSGSEFGLPEGESEFTKSPEEITFKFSNIKSNIPDSKIKFNFKNLNWPQLISGSKVETKTENDPKSVAQIEMYKEILNTEIKSTLKEFMPLIETQLSRILEEGAFEQQINGIGSVLANQFTEFGILIPGLFTKTGTSKITAGFNVTDFVNVNENIIGVNMAGFIEPGSYVKTNSGFSSTSFAHQFYHTRPLKSDLEVAINDDFINRYLDINFQNGYFSKLYLEGYGIVFSFREAPVATIMTEDEMLEEGIKLDPNKIYLKVSSSIDLQVTDLSIPFFGEVSKSQIVVYGTVLLGLEKTNSKSFKVTLNKIYSDSILTTEIASNGLLGDVKSGFQYLGNKFLSLTRLSTVVPQIADVTKKIRRFVNSKVNKVLLDHPLDMLGTLNMGPNGLKEVQVLPDQLMGLPLEIQSVSPLGDLLTLELNVK